MKNTFSKIIYLFIFSFFLFPSFSFAELIDDFDTYSTGSLNGQGSWTATNYNVIDTDYNDSPNSILKATGGNGSAYQYISNTTSGTQKFYVKYTGVPLETDIQLRYNSYALCSWTVYQAGTSSGVKVSHFASGTIFDDVPTGEWLAVEIEYNASGSDNCRYRYNNSSWSSWFTKLSASASGYNNMWFQEVGSAYQTSYIDSFGSAYVPPDTSTRIVWNEPTEGTSTPSRTIDVDFDYYITSVSSTTYDRIHVDFCSLGYPDDDCERLVESPLTYDSLTNVATSTTLNRDGYYLGLIYFTDGVSRVFGSQSVKFNSATTTLVADIPLLNPVSMCDSLDGTFDTAICKSMLFLFYPSDTAINRFNSISDIFEDKIPFGYYYSFKDKLENFSLSSTTAPVLSFDFGSNGSTALSGTMTIFDLDDIDTNFDFSLAWTWIIRFMWITFGVYVIARTLQVASVI